MEVREEAMDLLCMACLCVGRTLKKITDEKLKQYYMDTLNEIPLCITTQVVPVVCWECEAMLRKVTVFKEQVKDSYRILQTYTKENLHECLITEIGRPSRLKVHHNEHNIIIFEDQNSLRGVKCERSAGEIIHGDQHCSEESKRHFVEVEKICDNRKKNAQKCPLSEVRRSRLRHRPPVDESLQVKIKNEESRLNECHSGEESKVEEIVTVLCDAKKSRRKDWQPKTERNGVDTLAIEEYEVEIFGSMESKEDQGAGSDSNGAENFGRSDSDADLSMTQLKIKEKQPIRTKFKSVKKKKNDKDSKQSSLKVKSLELSYEDMQAERTRRAHRRSFVDAQHKCSTCLVVFDCAAAQRAHHKSKHSPELGEYICPICYIIVATVESFTAHYKRHIRRYQCGVCEKRTLDLKTMNRHLFTRHGKKTKRYKRRKIAKDSGSAPGRDSPKGRVECEDCDKTFSHRAGLLNHRLAVHESQNEFPCNVCEKVFRWKTSLKRHLEKHQTKGAGSNAAGGGAYCDACDIAFSSVCSLQRHLRNSLKHVTQDQLKFICEHCSKRFADKTKLRNHIEEKHLHWTYTCHICGKPSKNRVGLEQHVRNVHKGRPHNKICQHCGKGFPTKVQLESHIRTHTGERPFICEFCPTTFSQQSNLYKHHRQVHLNIKSKRYPAMCKKRKDGTQTTVAPPAEDLPVPPLLYYENILGV